MRQFVFFSTVAACIGFFTSTNASAQEVEIYVGPAYGYTYGRAYGPDNTYRSEYNGQRYYGPRVYGYSRRAYDDALREPDFGSSDYWAERDANQN
jgi:hypothetical protein